MNRPIPTAKNVFEATVNAMNEIPTGNSQREILDKHFKETRSSKITQTPAPATSEFETEYKTDFAKAAKDFWMKATDTDHISAYNHGAIQGYYTNNTKDLNEFLKRIEALIEGIAREVTEGTSEELKVYFGLIKSSFQILSKELTEKNVNLRPSLAVAFAHGYINAYVETCNKKS